MDKETKRAIEELRKEVQWLKEECARLKQAGQSLEAAMKGMKVPGAWG